MNKTVIITGANGNLGTIVTQRFLSNGYKVIATVHNEEARKNFLSHENLRVDAVNLTDEAATACFIETVLEEYKTIDAALLLVGGFAMGDIGETKLTEIKKQISLNFDTAYNVVHLLFQQMMKQNNGRIVFIGSRPALQASAGKKMIAYGLSKSLLFKLAEYMNAEAKGKNVTTSVVVPSTIDTEANRKIMPDANYNDWVKPEALAEVLEFLVSDKGSPLRETVLKIYNNA